MSARSSGKLAVVAGGTGGLGRAVILAFLEEGAKLIVSYKDQPEFDALQNAAAANVSSLEGHEVDVTKAATREDLLAETCSPNRKPALLPPAPSFR